MNPTPPTRAAAAAPLPRLCMLIESYVPVVGGMESQARTLAGSLHERGCELLFITRRTSPDLAPFERIDGLPVRRVRPSGRSSRLRWAMALTCIPALIRYRRHYDVIFVPGLRALGPTAVLMGKLLGCPSIVKGESCGELSGSFFHKGLESVKLKLSSLPVKGALRLRNRFMAHADAFVSMSSDMTAEFTGEGVPPERIHLIPQTVDVDRFQPAAPPERTRLRGELGLPADRLLVTYTGRLVSYKGLPVLLRAWQRIANDRADAVLVIVGAGGVDVYNCEQELKDFVSAHDLQDRVIFTGAVSNVEDYLKVSDVFAFPTENEAFGISLIEAMACRVPVIGTAVGGIRDILEHDANGLMIEAGREAALEAALRCLLAEPDLRERLGAAGLRTVRERYTRDIVAQKYIELFKRVAGGRSPCSNTATGETRHDG